MNSRRAFFQQAFAVVLVSAAPKTLFAQAATPDQNILRYETIRDVFNSLSEADRRVVQKEAKITGVYSGAVDGKFGPGTDLAIRALPKWIRENTSGRIIVEADTPVKLKKFLTEVARLEWSAWLYGEGGENDM
jgi:peptidoglycan hydrolase-like protein with peptidoglycan-binding domain